MKLNKFVAGAALVAALGLGSIATTQTAEAASGSVTSYVANDPIVGVWIEVEGGGSGWATLTGRYQQRATWSYNTKGRRFKAHIGVGGDHINWGRTCVTGWKNDGTGIALEAYGIPGVPWLSWTN